MREVDPEPIAAYLARLKGESAAYNAYMQRLEMLRERLLADDAVLTGLMDRHPHIDIGIAYDIFITKKGCLLKFYDAHKYLFSATNPIYHYQNMDQINLGDFLPRSWFQQYLNPQNIDKNALLSQSQTV